MPATITLPGFAKHGTEHEVEEYIAALADDSPDGQARRSRAAHALNTAQGLKGPPARSLDDREAFIEIRRRVEFLEQEGESAQARADRLAEIERVETKLRGEAERLAARIDDLRIERERMRDTRLKIVSDSRAVAVVATTHPWAAQPLRDRLAALDINMPSGH